MAQIITRIYAAADKAAAAAKEVKTLGYGDSEVFVTGPSAGAAKADVAAGLAQSGLAKTDAEAIADEVLKGRSVVSVHAAFGGGAKATAALDKFDPIAAPATAIKAAPAKAAGSKTIIFKSSDTTLNDATPLSSWLNWPTLIDNPAWLSSYFKWPTLSDSTPKATLSNGLTTKVELSDDPAPLSRKFGWQLLTNDPTPLSSKFNWAVLKD
jgi:hypothetical protein